MRPNKQQQNHLVHLFPLPNLLLNPGGKITLNLFEPRYLNLLASCEKDGVPMAIGHAQAEQDLVEREGEDFIKIPHEHFPYICSEVGFGKVHTLAETDKGTKVIVVSGDAKGRIKKVHQSEGGFLSVELEEVPLDHQLDDQMIFMYRRLRSITREKIRAILSNDREVEVLMQNLHTPEELVAFYTDHVCRDFSVRISVFKSNDINEKLHILLNSLVH